MPLPSKKLEQQTLKKLSRQELQSILQKEMKIRMQIEMDKMVQALKQKNINDQSILKKFKQKCQKDPIFKQEYQFQGKAMYGYNYFLQFFYEMKSDPRLISQIQKKMQIQKKNLENVNYQTPSQSLVKDNKIEIIQTDQTDDKMQKYSQFVKQYDQLNPIFINQKLEEQGISIDNFQQQNIKIINGSDTINNLIQDYYRLKLESQNPKTQTSLYSLYISKYQIPLTFKNFNCDSSFNSFSKFSEGGSGEVYCLKSKDGKKGYCIKRIKFQFDKLQNIQQIQKKKNSYNLQLKTILREIGICKLMNVMNIGPEFQKINDCDAFVYNDCVIFITRLCSMLNTDRLCEISQWQQTYQRKEIQKIKKDVGWRIALLHSMKMVHRDIKIGNIVYDALQKQYLLCDFGLTYSIKQRPSMKSKVIQPGGTLGYMPQDLRSFTKNWNKNPKKEFQYQLYYADVYAIAIVIEKIQQYQRPKDVPEMKVIEFKKFQSLLNEAQTKTKQFNKKFDQQMFQKQGGQQLKIKKNKGQEKKVEGQNLGFNFIDKTVSETPVNNLYQKIVQNQQQQSRQIQDFQGIYNVSQEFQAYQQITRLSPNESLRIRVPIIKKILKVVKYFNYNKNFSNSEIYLEPENLMNQHEVQINRFLTSNSWSMIHQMQMSTKYMFIKCYDQTPQLMKMADKTKQEQYEQYKTRFSKPSYLKLIIDISQQLIQIVPKIAEYRKKKGTYESQDMAILFINIALQMLKMERGMNQLQKIKQHCKQASSILSKINMSQKCSMLYVKIQFIKALLFTDSERWDLALQHTLRAKQGAGLCFGRMSCFYLDMVLNQAYLQRNKDQRVCSLIRQLINNQKQRIKVQNQIFFTFFPTMHRDRQIPSPKWDMNVSMTNNINAFGFLFKDVKKLLPCEIQSYLSFKWLVFKTIHKCRFFANQKYLIDQRKIIYQTLKKSQKCENELGSCNKLKKGQCENNHIQFELLNGFQKNNKLKQQWRSPLIHSPHSQKCPGNHNPSDCQCQIDVFSDYEQSLKIFKIFQFKRFRGFRPKKCKLGLNCPYDFMGKCCYIHDSKTDSKCKYGQDCANWCSYYCSFAHLKKKELHLLMKQVRELRCRIPCKNRNNCKYFWEDRCWYLHEENK